MKKDNSVYLKHVLESIVTIEQYIKGLSYEKFIAFDNKKTQDAVIRNLEIIGEAVNNLSEEYITEHPKVSWKEIIEMRNLLIHEYFGIDLEIVWNTLIGDLPKLKEKILTLV